MSVICVYYISVLSRYFKTRMGFPSPAEDHADLELDLHTHLVAHPAATFFWRYTGSEMERAGIHHGALLVVDRSLTARDGDVVVAFHLGEWLVRYLRHDEPESWLQNAPLDPHTTTTPIHDDTLIWGVVIHAINTLRVGSTRSDRYGDVSDGQG